MSKRESRYNESKFLKSRITGLQVEDQRLPGHGAGDAGHDGRVRGLFPGAQDLVARASS